RPGRRTRGRSLPRIGRRPKRPFDWRDGRASSRQGWWPEDPTRSPPRKEGYWSCLTRGSELSLRCLADLAGNLPTPASPLRVDGGPRPPEVRLQARCQFPAVAATVFTLNT